MAKFASIASLKMLKDKNYVFSTAYLAPVEYYFLLNKATEICIEQHEYYEKQSYRNRCRILTANGVMDLSIPVEKSGKMRIRDIQISEHDKWQSNHWRAIESAYNSSPFFEYYADDIRPFFENKWKYLWDFNCEIQQTILELLDVELNINFSSTYIIPTDNILDLRNLIHPKKETQQLLKPYYQVFDQKFGFSPNLSIMDLLFNMGPESQLILGY